MKQKILLIFLIISIGLIQSFAFHHQTDDLFLKDPDITRYPVGEKILRHYTIFKLVSLFSSNKHRLYWCQVMVVIKSMLN